MGNKKINSVYILGVMNVRERQQAKNLKPLLFMNIDRMQNGLNEMTRNEYELFKKDLFVLDSANLGVFDNVSDAQFAVTENKQDMADNGYFNYAVIEKVPFGLYANTKSEIWYKFDGKHYVQISKCPENLIRASGGIW